MNLNTTWLITGGAGFIGSNLVQHVLKHTTNNVVVVDKLTYSGSMENLIPFIDNPRFTFVKEDICDQSSMFNILQAYKPQAVLNLAAETHVDKSIDNPDPFIHSNFVGTYSLLEATRLYFSELDSKSKNLFRFVQVSTDEVYGSTDYSNPCTEASAYNPSSVYSASKAGADHLASAYFKTFGVPTIVTNCSNNYGPNQLPEKLLPMVILNAMEGKSIPVYGSGYNIRNWLYVDDHCSALTKIVEQGKPGEKYNIGSNEDRTNMNMIIFTLAVLNDEYPSETNTLFQATKLKEYSELIQTVTDRPGHDKGYVVDSSKLRKELGWYPSTDINSGLYKTVMWYLQNSEWLKEIEDNRTRQGVIDEQHQQGTNI